MDDITTEQAVAEGERDAALVCQRAGTGTHTATAYTFIRARYYDALWREATGDLVAAASPAAFDAVCASKGTNDAGSQ